MKNMRTIVLSFLTIFMALGCSCQTVGLSLSDIKAPPQYLILKKDKMNVYSNGNVHNQPVTKNQSCVIPSFFSVDALPFFCKIEYKMGLNKKLPLKFRLGDVQYVDELEGKH